MDRKIERRPLQRYKFWGYAGLGLLLLGLAIFAIRYFFTRPVQSSDIVLATVERGMMESTLSATGLVRPTAEVLLTSPISTRIQTVVLDNGAEVDKGDVILTLDTEFAQLEYSKLQDELQLQENNVDRLQLTLEKDIRDIEIDDEIQELQVQSLKAQLKDAQRLQKIGGATVEEVERAEQNLKIAQLNKRKLENELAYRQASIDSDVRNERLQSSIQRTTLDELGKKIALTQVKSPTPGVVTWLNNSIGTQVEQGAPLARIANLTSYFIEATASDMHTEKIKVGLPVRIRINSEYLSGRVEQILPAMENNTVQFKVALDQPDAAVLRPNMRVDVFVVRDQKTDARYVTNGRAYRGGKNQRFFVLDGDRLVQRELEIGITNTNHIEILSGAEVGDQIVISDMKRYEDQDIVPFENK